mgnify:CR=1 FL=1
MILIWMILIWMNQVLEYTDGDLYWRDRYDFEALITNYLPDPAPFDQLTYTGDKL